MALGDGAANNYSNDNNKRYEDPTVYSPLNFKNPDADIDPGRLSFSFWKNLLKIIISPKLEERPTDKFVQYADSKSSGAIFINSIKAKIFHDEIRYMLENPGTVNNVGVPSGSTGLISFCEGKEYGVPGYVLVIRKLDEEGGTQSSYVYQFNTGDYYTSIRNFEETTAKFKKHSYEMVEIEAFLQMLLDFSNAQNYAMAYTVVDATKYETTKMQTKFDLLLDNFGLKNRSNNSGNSGGSSFFSKNGSSDSSSTNSRKTSLESLADELEG